ncbi:glycosyltransferase family 39 protein [Flavobacterium sp. CHNK8]|uniref:ArnT family glycosyltransferase n=1 Tax=Flavobacterium sp. CHNK8 TaxID=2871165 RepID=UPI001C8EC908|nr:glycosyltransferase family 39 protein [Flavobacterium sp. CHNK8]QZK91474.1 glycosyltransferase family 39 protein [Flavobacterium sp. CHNK8]
MKENQQLILIITIATLVRCIIAMSIGLGNDEVYYLTYAQHLQWNYFDHPPMVAFLIRLTTFNLHFTNELFVRLGAIALGAINTYLIYDICKGIKNKKAGIIASLLYTSSLYSSIIAGVFILPDSPQLFFWLINVYFLIQIVSGQANQKKLNYSLILFGLFSGLCIMSKIHGVFLWGGFGLYILIYKRDLLKNGYLYLAFLITLLLISPILIWNVENHFITYTYHSQRVTISRGINPSSFFREFFGGIFYNNPINYFLILISLIAVWKNKIDIEKSIKRLLLFLSLPLIILLLILSFFRDTLPHWSGPAFVTLLILASCYISDEIEKSKITFPFWRKSVYSSCILISVIAVAGILTIDFYPGTIGSKDESSLGKKDFTLDMYDWKFFKTEFKKVRDKDLQSGLTKTNFILNNKWFPGAHIDNYIAQPLGLDFIALGKLEDIHTYAWLNTYREQLKTGDDAYFITVSNSFSDPKKLYQKSFKKINAPIVIRQFRNKKPTRNMLVYLLEDYTGE